MNEMREKRKVTLFDTLESDRVFAVFDHSVDVPGGESGHRGVVDFQQEFILEELAAVARRSAREKLADDRELSILRAALQLQFSFVARLKSPRCHRDTATSPVSAVSASCVHVRAHTHTHSLPHTHIHTHTQQLDHQSAC